MKSEYDEFRLFLKAYSEKKISFDPIYARITGDMKCGLFLSQIVFLWGSVGDEFWHKDEQFMEELFLSKYVIGRMRRQLIKLQLIEVARKGIPPKLYYKLNIRVLRNHILSGYTINKDLNKPSPKNLENLNLKTKGTLKEEENYLENKKEEQKPRNSSSCLSFQTKIREEFWKQYRSYMKKPRMSLHVRTKQKLESATLQFIRYFNIQVDGDYDKQQIPKRVEDVFNAIKLAYKDKIDEETFTFYPGHLCSDLTWGPIMATYGEWASVKKGK